MTSSLWQFFRLARHNPENSGQRERARNTAGNFSAKSADSQPSGFTARRMPRHMRSEHAGSTLDVPEQCEWARNTAGNLRAKSAIWVVFLATLTTSSCTITPKQVIPPLAYQEEVGFHSSRAAYLLWIPGRQIGHHIHYEYQSSGNLLGDLITNSILESHHNNNPSKYTCIYDKADEAVFITSLRDLLLNQTAFKKVELVSNPNQAATSGLLIQVKFKTARVTNTDIKLSVELIIQDGAKKVYERTYWAKNDPTAKAPANFTGSPFVQQKLDVSQKLLKMVVGGINQWYENSRKK